MALSCLLRRAYVSIIPLAIRHAGAPKPSLAAAAGAAFRFRDGQRGLLPNFSTSSTFASSEGQDADQNLIRIIRSEIECAKEGIDVSLKIPAGFPFKIEDIPGEKTVSLKRRYQSEVIKVLADMPDHVANKDEDVKAAADDEESQDQSSIPLVVSITKENGLCLEFGVTAYPDEISIDYMSTKNPNLTDDQLPYEGPDFTDLDESLQKAFHKYLDIRGIKPSVTNFLIEYMVAKDAKEYLRWLKNLENFHQ
uniref:Mitochondrial glycoprotein n=1 Tax=Kalanchoe fedtschenkoi TaxID=63787 RepID=A0A7N0RI11_KALFE